MKIATWNVNSLRVRLEQVCDWLGKVNPDFLALQETKLTDENFPSAAFEALGYQTLFSGQPTYNGVALISRETPTDVLTNLKGMQDPQHRVLGATYGKIRILNLYVPNGQSIDSEKYQYKLQWLKKLDLQLADDLAHYERLVVLGDFNIAPEDNDVHDPAAWEDDILVSPLERAALERIKKLGLTDVFRLFDQEDKSFSWWDYRAAAFRRNRGLRIDLILASKSLSQACSYCRIDTEPRKLERPSDHTPVVAEFSL
tara:strand:- start:486 stop:1253 length:768 start_codon:yes stop_codon:yes gene_type:complete